MTAFAGLVDRLFADPNLGRDATYEPADGEPVSVRVVARRADAVTEFGGGAALVGDDAASTSASPRWRTRGRATGSSSTARPSSCRASRCGIASGWSGRST